MRKIKEVIRLKWEQRLTNRAIARSCSIGRATVGEYLRRAAVAGLSWPLAEELDEAELERKLFPPLPFIPVELRPLPNWPEIHLELQRKGMTLLAVSGGEVHSLGIRSDGCLWAWGRNDHGQLWMNDTFNRDEPTPVGSYMDWAAVSSGGIHSLGIRSDGSLWSWGHNGFGQLGLNDTDNRDEPTRVGNWPDWVSIEAGDGHSLGIRADGSLWSWGANGSGQLGLNDTQTRDEPNRVGIWTDWVSIDDRYDYSLGIRSDGSLWSWGYNSFGQLGLNDTKDRWVPTRVFLPNTMIWLPLILKN